MASDINGLAQAAYAGGRHPIQWAEELINELINLHVTVTISRQEDPGAYPGYPIPLTLDALSRRILGELLDAGWTPPDGDMP
jgi:hypothetical protein